MFLTVACAENLPTVTPDIPAPTATYIVIDVTPVPVTPLPPAQAAPLSSPSEYLNQVLWDLERYESFKISGTLSKSDRSEPAGTGEQFEVKGEILATFNASTSPNDPTAVFFWPWPTSFDLRFLPTADDPNGTEETLIRSTNGRVVENSTMVEFKAYASYQEFMGDPDKDPDRQPNFSSFLSMALSGGRDAEFNVYDLARFFAGEVTTITTLGEGGSYTWVLEGRTSRTNGDEQTWRVWIDEDKRVRRIVFKVESPNDPERDTIEADLEFSDYGEHYPFPGFGGLRPAPPPGVTPVLRPSPTPVRYKIEVPTTEAR